jgi:hypothetical protein
VSREAKTAYVPYLPDLMTWEDYARSHCQKTIRIRLRVTDQGLEVLGDSPYPQDLEKILAALEPQVIEQMLCG